MATFPDRLAVMRRAAERKSHGTRARYSVGCRCVPCRAANSRYESERLRARARGDRNPIVDADRAKRHLAKLSRRGVGRRSVAAACDVAHTILRMIICGERKRIRKRTESAILGVDEGARAGNSLVAAGRTRKLMSDLVARGYSKAELARRLGYKTPAIQFLSKAKVTARIAASVERLYQSIELGVMRPGRIR